MKRLTTLLTLAFLCFSALAQAQAPLRSVTGRAVASLMDPPAQIEVLAHATYVGAIRFTLFGTADCEIHLFADADASKRIRRLYWIQFESYLPEHPTLTYSPTPNYTPLEMSGLLFYQRARFGRSTDVPRPDSDADQAYSLLKVNGYSLPPETVNVTYKHFFGDMRKELLLMVIEDMALSGTTFTELVQGGSIHASWGPIAEQLQARASKVFAIQTRDSLKP